MLKKEGKMICYEMMQIARQMQRNLERIGIAAVIETKDGAILVRGLNSKGEPFNIRIQSLALNS
jgi:hypothetical protein